MCPGDQMAEPVYKILSKSAFEEARAKGRFDGSAVDLRDGFIHLSAGPQVAGTLAAHFAGQAGLVLLAVDTGAIGGRLKWEPSRGGDLFPHLYGPLDLKHVVSVDEIVIGEDGVHRLPAGLAA
jgi:uncharacterized protein (DUF952 family)